MKFYPNTKIYHGGSHFIGIPHEEKFNRKRKSISPQKNEQKLAFEKIYEQNKSKKKTEKAKIIVKEIKDKFDTEEDAKAFVNENLERKERNFSAKMVRFYRKVNLQEWHFFAKFTYDNNKHTEDSFKKSLSNCLKHLSSRKG